MEPGLSAEDRARIEESIRRKYAKVSLSPEGLFTYPTGRDGLRILGYDPEIVRSLPEAAVDSYCGVGNPFVFGPMKKGESVLDIGCGGGVDSIIAAIMVEPEGSVAGIDVIPEMLERAERNLKETNTSNVRLHQASAESLPFSDKSFDAVISNGVFNLIPDKYRALCEAFRVLQPKGRIIIADQILSGRLPTDRGARIDSWFR
jgi:arsenite methyltransferase